MNPAIVAAERTRDGGRPNLMTEPTMTPKDGRRKRPTKPILTEIEQLNAEARQATQRAAKAFVSAVAGGDRVAIADTFEAIDKTLGWRAAMKSASRLQAVDDAVRLALMRVWMGSGDAIRSQVSDDLVLLDGLRALLPSYTGPAVILYRGETAGNRTRRTYGLSWSASLDVAQDYARRETYRTAAGGSVVLRTAASPVAIVCSPYMLDHDNYAEQEYIVDRRLLSRVDVVERLAQLQPRSESRQP